MRILLRPLPGFSLIEVMVAMAVLVIGLLAMAPLVAQAIVSGSQARKSTAAQLLAQDILERLRAEIRYDGALQGEPVLSAGEWKFDILPHTPDLNTNPAGCHLAGDDGVEYDHGPFEFVREDQSFSVCYDLHAVTGAVPPVPLGTMSVRIRVQWRHAAGGWSSFSLGDLLVSGA
jgi:prepilin-type N-terminal cleavage/methylation domain-containing protein